MASNALSNVSQSCFDRRVTDLRYRQKQLRSLHAWLTSHVEDLTSAVKRDESCSEPEAKLMISATLNEVRKHYDQLELRQEVKAEYSIRFGRDFPDGSDPVGIVYVIPQSKALLFSIMSPLCAAIAAQNCCVVEVPNNLTGSSSLARQCIQEALDKAAFVAVSSRANPDFLAQCALVDQSGTVGLQSSPYTTVSSYPTSRVIVVVDRTAEVSVAAKEIVHSTLVFGGRSVYRPDCVLVNEFVRDEFLDAVKTEMEGLSPSGKPQMEAIGEFKPRDTPGNHSQPTDSKSKACAEALKVESREKSENVAGLKSTDKTSCLLSTEVSSEHLEVHAFSSLDHAIDSPHIRNDRLLALYVYAEPAQAKYLAQFIATSTTFVNFIPAEVLVGPAFPSGFPFSINTRYTRSMFELPSPKYNRPRDVGDVSAALFNNDHTKTSHLYIEALGHLKPTGQPVPHYVNFFLQAFRASAVVYLGVPLVACSTFAWALFK